MFNFDGEYLFVFVEVVYIIVVFKVVFGEEGRDLFCREGVISIEQEKWQVLVISGLSYYFVELFVVQYINFKVWIKDRVLICYGWIVWFCL